MEGGIDAGAGAVAGAGRWAVAGDGWQAVRGEGGRRGGSGSTSKGWDGGWWLKKRVWYLYFRMGGGGGEGEGEGEGGGGWWVAEA